MYFSQVADPDLRIRRGRGGGRRGHPEPEAFNSESPPTTLKNAA